ncbi:MAG TPA: methyltransferase domain-containing protein [Acidimicrobiales bacterium]|nr:methyltransferase domain-containing protein [Acidimicrobiales bacterium]
MGYSPRQYWEGVGERLGERSENRLLAGEESPFYAVKRSMFLEKLLLPAIGASDRMVLEVGCGPGGNIQWLEERGVQMLGLDLSSAMLQAARRSGVTRLVQGDATSLPIASRAVDAAITVTVLQHNDDEAAARIVAELARVARWRVHLFEDTGGLAIHDRASHWLRRPEWYVAELGRAGYRLETRLRLPLACSELVANGLRAVARRRQPEGAAIPENQMRLESKLLGVTTRIDSLLPPAMGLTRLSFTRSCG